jgi:thymidylate synthase
VFTCFNAKTADAAWRLAAEMLLDGSGVRTQDGRSGNTREILHCALTVENPRARWVLSRKPSINPAFAIVESFWILAGRNDAKLINFWNPALPRFSGQTDRYPGAYGHRLRKHYELDQIEAAFKVLSVNPNGRQVMLQIWDPRTDMPLPDGTPAAADIPCNICSLIKVRDGRLEWLQLLRSNDLFRGLPYNFIQFTILQEVMAGWLGLELGSYNHVADSLHVYETDLNTLTLADEPAVEVGDASLALPKKEFEHTLMIFMGLVERLAAADLASEEFERLCRAPDLPRSYHDLLVITAADSARRRGWEAEQRWAEDACAQPILRQVWAEWAKRSSMQIAR